MNPPVDLSSCIGFRMRALAGGFTPVRLGTGQKSPVAKSWQRGETTQVLLRLDETATNTGILATGLRVLDVDVDDADRGALVFELAERNLPPGAMVRRRQGSSRFALIYRAAVGSPSKISIRGPHGVVEVLGDGQQVMVDGVHPSGAAIEWLNDRSPATVPVIDLPVVTEGKIAAFLEACGPLLGAATGVTTQSNLPPRLDPSGRPVAVTNELAAGIEVSWFDGLRAAGKRDALKACFHAIDNTIVDPRDQWMKAVFAAADAEERGCVDAHDLALEWSKRGAHFASEADFEALWNSYKPGRTTVGTLLHLGAQAGADLAGFRPLQSLPPVAPAAAIAALALPATSVAISVAQLPKVPPKRLWLHGTDIVRGAVSLIVAPGGRGKSTFLLTLGLACASGKPLLGANVFGGPLRALYINAEDPINEVARRTRAAMVHHQLSETDLATLRLVGADQLKLSLMTADKGMPRIDPAGWGKLRALVDHETPDVLIIDPLVSLMGGVSLNDNSAAALLMGEFVRLAASHNLGLILAHHSSKNRETNTADAAMGAASIVNLARISLSLEPVSEADAPKIGVAPWDAKSILRLVGTKQNLSPPGTGDRFYRVTSVTLANAQPPIYPNGDSVGVIETFTPSLASTAYPQPILAAVVATIAAAIPPLAPSGRYSGLAAIAAAIAPHRNGQASDAEAKAIIDYLIRQGTLAITDVLVPRPGHGTYTRKGLCVAGSLPGHLNPFTHQPLCAAVTKPSTGTPALC